ncbi:MAG: TonB-dependent receptor [Kiritimatiellae bacterium]|nr:TonB-dependent receptor [Kiritimatiellia bacterium]
MGAIVVTARRASLPVSDAFAGVNVITAGEIARSNARNVPDVLSKCEGLQVEDASGVGASSKVSLRGFVTDMSSLYLVLVDGVPQNSVNDKLVDWNLIPLSNVEQVEVVRGPLSTLYGENAMSGVINIVTRGRTAQPETSLQAAYGSFDTLTWDARRGGAAGQVDYLFSLGQMSSDGFREHCDMDHRHVTGNLGLALDDVSRIAPWAQYSTVERGALPWALSEAQLAEDRNQARPGTENDSGESRKRGTGLTYERELLEALDLKTSGYYRREDGESFYTSGETSASTAEVLQDESLLGANLACTFTPELWKMPHTFVAGMDLDRATFDYDKFAAARQVRSSRLSAYDATRDGIGLYLEDEAALSERLGFLLGGRHSRLDYNFDDRLASTRDHDRDLTEDSFRTGARYDYRQGGEVYANVSQAFRAPTLGQMFTYESANPDLRAETALNYELGMRDRLGENLRWRINAFWMEVSDEIAYDYAAQRYANYGETSHKGLELGLETRSVAGFKGFANYTLVVARNEAGADEGRVLPHVPRHTGNIGLEYEQSAAWGASLTLHAMGASFTDEDNAATLPSYGTLDLRGWYALGPCRLFAEARNVLDADYYTYGYRRAGANHYSPPPGTTFNAGVSATF